MDKKSLRIDWATHEAAKFAVEHWHYSESLPVPPLVKVGAWERGEFIGVVIFSRGATPSLLKPYGLNQNQGCELVRVALRSHESQVTRIVRLALAFLKKSNPRLRLVVSFADPAQGHHGGIYQAGNWIYSGTTAPSKEYYSPDGKKLHPRMVKAKGWTTVQGVKRKTWKPENCVAVKTPPKHRYLMPLDKKMRQSVLNLSKPYPKRAGSIEGNAPSIQDGDSGSIPTPALQPQHESDD
jgi:hypothetical protein